MKIFLFLALALLPACTVITTENAGGKSTYASFGGDSKTATISPAGATIEGNRNSGAIVKTVAAAATVATAVRVIP